MEPWVPRISEPGRRWIRFGALVAALALLCWILLGLRSVFTPILLAAALAYVFNPLVTWFERARRIPRLATVVVVFVLLGIVALGGGAYVASLALAQLESFQQNFGDHMDRLGVWLQARQAHIVPARTTIVDALATKPATTAATTAPTYDWWLAIRPLVREHGIRVAGSLLDYGRRALSNVFGLLSVLVLVPLFTFYFLWRFNDLVDSLRRYLPAAYRDGIVHIVGTIDAAMSAFFRGRLIVCLAVGVVTAVGWTIVGVPYSIPLGLLTGVLNLVPFMTVVTLPPALLLTWLRAAEAGAPWALPVVLTMAVFMAAQALESFVLGPLVMGKSSGLHPLVIVVALMIGGSAAGLLGLLLAIPVASTLRTLGAELLMPEVRRLAGLPVPGPAVPTNPEPPAAIPGSAPRPDIDDDSP